MFEDILSLTFSKSKVPPRYLQKRLSMKTWLGGAMVARLTPDQKVACSNHVGVTRKTEDTLIAVSVILDSRLI